jgi:hypothetical protein
VSEGRQQDGLGPADRGDCAGPRGDAGDERPGLARWHHSVTWPREKDEEDPNDGRRGITSACQQHDGERYPGSKHRRGEMDTDPTRRDNATSMNGESLNGLRSTKVRA